MKTALVTLLICTLLPTTVTARNFSWTNGEIRVTTNDIQAPNSNLDCQNRLVRIGSRPTIGLTSVCIYERPSWSYGYYTHKSGPSYAPNYSTKFVVAIGNDSAMYELSGLPRDGIIHTPDYDGLLFDRSISPGIWESRHVTVVKNLPASIERSYDAANKTVSYALKSGARSGLIKDSAGNTVTTHAVDVSPSGAKLAIEIKSLGLAVYDLHTGELRVFSDFKSKPWPFVTRLTFAVDPSGEYVAVKRDNSYIRVHAPLSSCAVSNNQYSDDLIQRVEASDLCDDDGSRTQTALDEELGADRAKRIYNLAFNDEGSAIKGYTSSLNPDFDPDNMDDYTVTEVKILANGYVDQQQLEYLALGDSYSSGEGDVGKRPNGTSYYTPVTDLDGGCHISTRSYPFLLRDKWNIDSDKMQSVACSGAQVLPDIIGSRSNYPGQLEWVKRMPNDERKRRQQNALERFIPGYTTQIEFVRKYQPNRITLTAGGNDVGFGDILRYCASFNWLSFWPLTDNTCHYAKEGTALNKSLYRTIDQQYIYTKLALKKLKMASKETEIILIGYPSFIAPALLCSLDDAAINHAERKMMDEAVTYMNSALSSAASEEDALFIDISTILNGGRICEGSSNVTGALSANIIQEMFHPNASGHKKIANRIYNSYKSTTERNTAYQFPSDHIQTIRKDMVSSSAALAGSIIPIELNSFSLRPNSTAKLTAYSKETPLGVFSVSPDGSLLASVQGSLLPVGIHSLILEGETPSGESVHYTQFIEIHAQVNDIDGDGVPNDKDKCQFIEQWIDERTGKDVCSVEPNASPRDLSNSKSRIAQKPEAPAPNKISDNSYELYKTETDTVDKGMLDRSEDINDTTVGDDNSASIIPEDPNYFTVVGIVFTGVLVIGAIIRKAYVTIIKRNS